MASALQLPREELLRAYRQMRTIREFEDTVHDEFSAGNIPGFVHLYAGEEASADRAEGDESRAQLLAGGPKRRGR